MTASVDPQRLRDALRVAAQIVARDGEAFLPVFMRLETEVAALDTKNAALERARILCVSEGQAGYSAISSNASLRPASPPPSP